MKLENLKRYAKVVDEKVSSLQAKVDSFRAFKNKIEKKINEPEDRLDFVNMECKSFKVKCEINKLQDKKLDTWKFTSGGKTFAFSVLEEDAREVLVGFQNLVWRMQTKSNSKGSIELESVHLPMVNLDK